MSDRFWFYLHRTTPNWCPESCAKFHVDAVINEEVISEKLRGFGSDPPRRWRVRVNKRVLVKEYSLHKKMFLWLVHNFLKAIKRQMHMLKKTHWNSTDLNACHLISMYIWFIWWHSPKLNKYTQRAEFPLQLVGRQPHQLSGLPHQLCALSHQLVSDLIVFWLQNDHFPPQPRKAIGFEDIFAFKLLFARFSKDNHHGWHGILPHQLFPERSIHDTHSNQMDRETGVPML